MKLASYLEKDHALVAESFPDTTAFYHEFSHFLKENGVIRDSKTVKRLFLKRELVQSTGIGKGAATPHIFSKEFARFQIFAALVRSGVDFKSPDGIPVSLVFLIVSDDRDVGLHLKSLAHIARMVLSTDIVESAKRVKTGEELCQLLLETEKTI